MNFSTQQLPSGKWGIYSDSRLLATVSCRETCLAIFSNLSTGRRDAPNNDTNALYQIPELRHQPSKPKSDSKKRKVSPQLGPSKSSSKEPKPSSKQRSSKVNDHTSVGIASGALC